MLIDEIGGIMPVLYSFFDEDGGLNLKGYEHQVEHSINQGATGVVLFGFVTQFYRLSFEEKIQAIQVVRRALPDNSSLGVTVMEQTVEAQLNLIHSASCEGADWIILQPPLGPPIRAVDWSEMLIELIKMSPIPVAVQNADIANAQLTNQGILDLQNDCPNLVGVKAETNTIDVADFLVAYSDRFRVITGDWGIEYPFFLRQGAHGLIPAPNFVGEQVAMHNAATQSNWEVVDRLHSRLLPLLSFVRERPDLEAQMLLGKHAYCLRTGFEIGYNRKPGPNNVDPRLLVHLETLVRDLVSN